MNSSIKKREATIRLKRSPPRLKRATKSDRKLELKIKPEEVVKVKPELLERRVRENKEICDASKCKDKDGNWLKWIPERLTPEESKIHKNLIGLI